MPETLRFETATERVELLASPVAAALASTVPSAYRREITVAEIDPDAADTAVFCERYGVALEESANCVVVATRRGGAERSVACVVLSTTRVDVNGLVRRHVGARKASFASMDAAVAETGMAYGGITPIGLPGDWPLLVDSAVTKTDPVIVGSGLRSSKLRLPGAALAELPGVDVLDGLGQ